MITREEAYNFLVFKGGYHALEDIGLDFNSKSATSTPSYDRADFTTIKTSFDDGDFIYTMHLTGQYVYVIDKTYKPQFIDALFGLPTIKVFSPEEVSFHVRTYVSENKKGINHAECKEIAYNTVLDDYIYNACFNADQFKKSIEETYEMLKDEIKRFFPVTEYNFNTTPTRVYVPDFELPRLYENGEDRYEGCFQRIRLPE